jgi:hypothetical protein
VRPRIFSSQALVTSAAKAHLFFEKIFAQEMRATVCIDTTQPTKENWMTARTKKIDWLLSVLLVSLLAAGMAFAASGKSFTGTVSDSMCGAKHAMPGDDAACTRACVGKGSKYALVVGDKVNTLDTTDKAALATLDKQAGAKATVTGTEKDNTIAVSSVKAAK